MDKQTRPGENEAVASVVLGIVSCVLVVPLFLTAQRYNPILYTAIPIEYNDVCKSEKEIDKPLGAPVK